MAATTAATLRGKIGQELVRGQTNWHANTAFAHLDILEVSGPHIIKDVLTADLMEECGCAGWSTHQYIQAWAKGDHDCMVHIVSFQYIPMLSSHISGARNSAAAAEEKNAEDGKRPGERRGSRDRNREEKEEEEEEDGDEKVLKAVRDKKGGEKEAARKGMGKEQIEENDWDDKLEKEVEEVAQKAEEREIERVRRIRQAEKAGRKAARAKMDKEEEKEKKMKGGEGIDLEGEQNNLEKKIDKEEKKKEKTKKYKGGEEEVVAKKGREEIEDKLDWDTQIEEEVAEVTKRAEAREVERMRRLTLAKEAGKKAAHDKMELKGQKRKRIDTAGKREMQPERGRSTATHKARRKRKLEAFQQAQKLLFAKHALKVKQREISAKERELQAKDKELDAKDSKIVRLKSQSLYIQDTLFDLDDSE